MIDRLRPAGTESQVLALFRQLDRRQVEPFLCLLDGEDSLSRSLEPDNCPVLRLGVRSLARPSTLARTWRLARFLRRQRIDVLQVHFQDSTYLGIAAGVVARVPFIVTTRRNMGYAVGARERLLRRALRPFVSATIANCEACRQCVIADERLTNQSVVVLENGVDLTRFENLARAAPGPSVPRRVGAVANLRPPKGIDDLVSAARIVCAAHGDVAFEVAGEGELRPALERQIAEAGLSNRFRLHGSLEDIPDFLAGLDVAVLASTSEGMPNAVLEYMAAGRAIVATDVGGIKELLQDSVHGILVPPGEPARLADAIDQLLGHSELAARLGAAARRRACERYSLPGMARRFETFYRDLVGAGH
jgi:glycosyltransferase involved in cell wall biosynthesis